MAAAAVDPAFASLPLKQRVKLLDQQYKKSRRDWSKPSVTFRNKSERFKTPRQLSPGHYGSDVKQHTIAGSVGGKAPCSSPAFRDKRPQREAASPKTDVFYDAKDPSTIGQRLRGRSAFASMTPRLAEVAELDQGQQHCGIDPEQLSAPRDRTVQNRKGSTAFLSHQPRLAPTRAPLCDQQYKPVAGTGTFDEIVANLKKGPKHQAWAADKSLQRPIFTPRTDLTYSPKDISQIFKVRTPGSTGFVSATPRLEAPLSLELDPIPGPGTYASPLISAGMLP